MHLVRTLGILGTSSLLPLWSSITLRSVAVQRRLFRISWAIGFVRWFVVNNQHAIDPAGCLPNLQFNKRNRLLSPNDCRTCEKLFKCTSSSLNLGRTLFRGVLRRRTSSVRVSSIRNSFIRTSSGKNPHLFEPLSPGVHSVCYSNLLQNEVRLP